MATWAEVTEYVTSNYRVSSNGPNMLSLVFNFPDARSQRVFLWHMTLRDGMEHWMQIESPIAPMDSVNIREALGAVGSLVCGGLAELEGVLTLRHCMPLANLDANEFESPLHLVVATADRLEAQLTGADRF